MRDLLPSRARAGNAVREWMLDLVGANRTALRNVPEEAPKLTAMAGAMLVTAALAWLSATIALGMALHLPFWAALPLGLAWAWCILAIDRWLVVTVQRQGFGKTLLSFLPRIGLALVIGLVVSTPLTLLVFSSEIDAQIRTTQTRAQAEWEASKAEDPRYQELEAKRDELEQVEQELAAGITSATILQDPEVARTQQRLDSVDEQFREAEQAVACEKEGTCGSGQAGAGPASADKEARRDRLAAERETLTAELAEAKTLAESRAVDGFAAHSRDLENRKERLTGEVDTLATWLQEEDAATRREIERSDGLLARLVALSDLEHDEPAMRTAHYVLFAFLTLIEILPVIVKLLQFWSRPTAYELEVKAVTEEARGAATLARDLRLEEAQAAADLEDERRRVRHEQELAAEKAAAQILLDAQLDLLRDGVDRWRQSQQVDVAVTGDADDSILGSRLDVTTGPRSGGPDLDAEWRAFTGGTDAAAGVPAQRTPSQDAAGAPAVSLVKRPLS